MVARQESSRKNAFKRSRYFAAALAAQARPGNIGALMQTGAYYCGVGCEDAC
jgi:hypothetical protein